MPNLFRSFSSLNTTNGVLVRTNARWILTNTYVRIGRIPNSLRLAATSIIVVL